MTVVAARLIVSGYRGGSLGLVSVAERFLRRIVDLGGLLAHRTNKSGRGSAASLAPT
jgi:hypothetical protein